MDLLIVSDRADQLAQAIQSGFAQLGKRAEILDILTAAQLFTLEIVNGKVAITPDLPLILRPTASEVMQKNFDQSFHHGESLSTLWAVAAACQSRVLNRPTPRSMWGLTSFSTVLTHYRAQLELEMPEQFTLNPPVLNPPVLKPQTQAQHQWYLQDMGTFETTVATENPPGQGPYRARQAFRDRHYEMVVVLANRAWRSTQVPLDFLNLESRSIQLLRNLDLEFGVVIWSIQPDLTACTIAKVEPFPTFAQVELVWHDLLISLYEEIFG